MSVKKSTYLIPTTEAPVSNGNGNGNGHGGGLSYTKKAELWGMFTRHLIGLATVLWWVWFKEAPPKSDRSKNGT